MGAYAFACMHAMLAYMHMHSGARMYMCSCRSHLFVHICTGAHARVQLEFKPQKLEVLKEASLADASVICDEWCAMAYV